MRICIWSPKGGVGKSSLSSLLQQIDDCQIITNDKMNPYSLILSESDYYLVNDNEKIPTFNNETSSLIWDLGGYSDERIPTFIQECKNLIVLIPFTSDVVSFQAAISVFNNIKHLNSNIFFILNRAKKGDYDIFKKQMDKMGINKALLEVKESKLFSNIFNRNQKISDIKRDSLLSHSYKTVLKQVSDIYKELKK